MGEQDQPALVMGAYVLLSNTGVMKIVIELPPMSEEPALKRNEAIVMLPNKTMFILTADSPHMMGAELLSVQKRFSHVQHT